MRLAIKLSIVVLVFFSSVYLIYPNPKFPQPPAGSLRSIEPGDSETTYRRAYYTNYSRSQIMQHYGNEFNQLPKIILDLPPEDSFTVIRDQTKSSWLQQIIHPGRESIYINGFYPTKPTEQIYIDGVHYLNKITVRFVPSNQYTRLTVLTMVLISIYLLRKEYAKI